jgi:hypothetical protein
LQERSALPSAGPLVGLSALLSVGTSVLVLVLVLVLSMVLVLVLLLVHRHPG